MIFPMENPPFFPWISQPQPGRMLLALLDLCLGPNAAPTAPLLWFLKSEPELSVPVAWRSPGVLKWEIDV
jgi:hypothetical protein